MLNTKHKEEKRRRSIPFWGSKSEERSKQLDTPPVLQKTDLDLANEKLFNDTSQKIIDSIEETRERLKTLEFYYNEYTAKYGFPDNNIRQAQIEEILRVIYVNGKSILNALKKINPKELFVNSELSTMKLSTYQSIHDDFAIQLKTLWVELYDLKEDHKVKMRDIIKTYMQANYPNETQEQVEHIAAEIVEQDLLLDVDVFNKYTTAVEVLNYVTARHKQLLKLENSLNELHQLFIDAWVLTQQQGESIDRIRENIQNAKNDIKISIDDFKEAYRYKKRWF